MKNCPNCGHPYRSKARFCTQCGAPLTGVSSSSPPGRSPITGAIQPGRVMNKKYTILGTLGKGGMGTVYLAQETLANAQRQVVVKEMLDYYDPADPQSAARAHKRFEAEAGTLVTLSFAGIPQIFDYFTENGRNYIVMQFIQGRNLESGLTHLDDAGALIKGNSYPPQQVRSWGIQLCKALEYLAGQNVVHMDIKPANLILDQSDTVWLVDFGTAKAQWVKQLGGGVGLQKSSIYGTNGYAPPEQAAGNPETRSDVFALAATLYHLLTDNHPGDNTPYTFPRLNKLPADLGKALRKSLTTDVSKRITAAEFRRLLGAQTSGSLPFRWQDGTSSSQPDDLATVANLNWQEARGYFEGDAWVRWFKDIHRNDLPVQLNQIKGQIEDKDIALDAFLRLLDPSFPLPKLQVSQAALNAGSLPWRSKRSIDLEIVNAGSGCLKVTFPNLPLFLQMSPSVVTVYDRRTVKVTIDAGLLSPGPRQQTVLLTMDAGSGGKAQIPISISVPEPRLLVSSPNLDLGSAYQGETVTASFTVSNMGLSPFIGEVTIQVGWLKVDPASFLCAPGSSQDLHLTADSQGLPLGRQQINLDVKAKANRWEQPAPIQVALHLSAFKTFLKYWAPPIGITLLGGVYGFCFGWVLGLIGQSLQLRVSSNLAALISGAAIGGLVCACIGALVGAASGIGNLNTRDSAWAGTALAGLLGGAAGAASGFIWRVGLEWLGILVSQGELVVYTALVGGSAAALLFLVLWKIRGPSTS